jgi:hypothetical protein
VAAKASALGSNPLKKSESVVRDMLRGGSPQLQKIEQARETTQTPVTQSLLRKTIYFDEEEWQAIRARCYQDDLTYTDVVRAAVRSYLRLA